MKIIFLISVLFIGHIAEASIIEDGKGFFPILVQTNDSLSGTPIAGISVKLENAGKYVEVDIDPERRTKLLPESLGKAVLTNEQGIAIVFYYAAWSRSESNGKESYSRWHDTKIVIFKDDIIIKRISLAEWYKKSNVEIQDKTAPWIIVPIDNPKD